MLSYRINLDSTTLSTLEVAWNRIVTSHRFRLVLLHRLVVTRIMGIFWSTVHGKPQKKKTTSSRMSGRMWFWMTFWRMCIVTSERNGGWLQIHRTWRTPIHDALFDGSYIFAMRSPCVATKHQNHKTVSRKMCMCRTYVHESIELL